MSYKNKMHPTISNAEIEVFKALSAAGLTRGMVTQQPIILKSTIPDFLWSEKHKCVYLDGEQVHRKRSEKDEEIDNILEIKGYQVLRIPYTAPLTTPKRIEILKLIQEFIKET